MEIVPLVIFQSVPGRIALRLLLTSRLGFFKGGHQQLPFSSLPCRTPLAHFKLDLLCRHEQLQRKGAQIMG